MEYNVFKVRLELTVELPKDETTYMSEAEIKTAMKDELRVFISNYETRVEDANVEYMGCFED